MKDPTAPEIKPIEPQPVIIDTEKTALIFLECWQLMEDPEYFAAPLIPGITRLLEKARAAGILTVFTLPSPSKGKPHGRVYSGFNRRPCEPVFFPQTFDKFQGGQLRTLLELYGVEALLMVGHKANMALLYTASHAVTEYHYRIIIPVDGIAATTEYEKEYTLYQFRAYPSGYPKLFTYTKLDLISFGIR